MFNKTVPCVQKFIWVILFVSSLLACDGTPSQGHKSKVFVSAGMRLYLEELVRTDDVVWAMDFIDSNTMIFTERKGQLKLLDIKTNEVRPINGGPVVFQGGSGGLFDILVDPGFETNGLIYLTYIKPIDDGSTTAVARGKLQDDEIVDLTDLFIANNVSADPAHWGSRVVIDEDRYLFITVGDRHIPDNAQDLKSHGGKVLRLNDDGSVPSDNPFVGRNDAVAEIWSYGHRNPQGLAIQPATGLLFEQEHGPTGGDEINIVLRGKNYGWPVITYGTDIWGGQLADGTAKAGMQQPLRFWQPGIAPCGMTFYTGDRYAAWQGNLMNSTLRGYLTRLVLDKQKIINEERLLEDWRERIRDVVQGPDDLLYVSTESGKIARIAPAQ
jgi:glucose/arabinose dehydrogenase